jgi:hypothetical protein
MAASGVVLAARYLRPESEGWVLPADVGDIVPWVKAAVRAWHDQDRSRFPSIADWNVEPPWLTPREEELVADVKEAERNLARAVEQHEGRITALRRELENAVEDSDRMDRAVLTERQSTLVEHVRQFLSELGFAVTDIDQERPTNDLLEDLRVNEPSDPDWIALAEVRAYKGGAAVNDLQRIARFVLRYFQECGREPSARWYVVNQMVGQDPSTRPIPLASNPNELQTFAEDGGLVIDTSELFRLVMNVRRGLIDQDAARQEIREARGAFLAKRV